MQKDLSLLARAENTRIPLGLTATQAYGASTELPRGSRSMTLNQESSKSTPDTSLSLQAISADSLLSQRSLYHPMKAKVWDELTRAPKLHVLLLTFGPAHKQF